MSNAVIKIATFNPRIKSYIFFLGCLLLMFTIIGIPFLIIWFLGVGQYTAKRYYENLSCTLTHRHLEFKKGVFFKIEKTIPLDNIQDLTFLDNPILRFFDIRILKIETAGNSNPQGTDMKLVGISDLEAFKKNVLNQRDLLMEGSSQPDTTPQNESVQLLKDIKGLLIDLNNK